MATAIVQSWWESKDLAKLKHLSCKVGRSLKDSAKLKQPLCKVGRSQRI